MLVDYIGRYADFEERLALRWRVFPKARVSAVVSSTGQRNTLLFSGV
jgi:hypothetical protein